MKYDVKDEKIHISLKEFVSIARRGISKSLPYDDEEPELKRVSKSEKEKLCKCNCDYDLKYEFTFNNKNFLLYGSADSIDYTEEKTIITVMRSLNYPLKKIKSSDEKETRGEGYILAKMLAEKSKLQSMTLKTVYINEELAESCEKEEPLTIKKINLFFSKCLTAVEIYSTPEIDRVTKRLPSMKTLKFPYKKTRSGQSEFVKSVYRTIARGNTLIACAPTGTGKTVSVIYPAIRALGDGRVDKIFYLTPKTTTANSARECLNLLAGNGAKIRAILLSSKEKCCENGLICRDDRHMCNNSVSNKLPDAVISLYSKSKTVIEKNDIEEVAKSYTVCPYELELAYSELCDIVICDFNYLFDPSVYIRRFFDDGGKFAFLVDEAHNLADRAREMYSVEIGEEDFHTIESSEILGEFSELKINLKTITSDFHNTLLPYLEENMRKDNSGEYISASHMHEVPYEIYNIFYNLLNVCESELQNAYRAKDEEKNQRLRLLKNFFYKIKKTVSVLEKFDSNYVMFLFLKNQDITMKLFAADTGQLIRERLNKGFASVFFSATLQPPDYYKSVLGADKSAETLTVSSPFNPEQLSVSIMDKISTRYSERDRTLRSVCRVIAATLSAKRGNYMVFAPSFEYCESLSKVFQSVYPKIQVLTQTKNMTAKEKSDFLKEFSKDSKNYLVGFCVLGGIYSEGVDLVGDSLIGAIVVGIGIPSISYEREAIAEFYQDKYEKGKEFAYIYPGINRVLQAAGRVIRRESDRGVVVLIDDRFDDPIYKKAIPELWKGLEYVSDAKSLKNRIVEFWKAENPN